MWLLKATRGFLRSTNAHALAALTIAVIQGLSTLARDGTGRDELLGVVEQAMYAWPRSEKLERSEQVKASLVRRRNESRNGTGID